MERLTKRNSMGVSVLQIPDSCENCNDTIWTLHDLGNGNPIERLAHYEDLAEQGRLIELPCKIGDKIFVIPSIVNYKLNVLNEYGENNRVYEQDVEKIIFCNDGRYLLTTCDGMQSVVSDFYKINWFLTRSEAEQALVDMGKEVEV